MVTAPSCPGRRGSSTWSVGPSRSSVARTSVRGLDAMQPALAGRDAPAIVSVSVVAGLAVPGALVELSRIAVVA